MIIEVFVPVLLLLLLLLLGWPVAFALAASGSVGLFFNVGPGTTMVLLRNITMDNTGSYLLTTIPMFILMAEFLNNSGLISDLFTAAHRWLSRFRGGLAFATTLANGMMAAMSGSSTATAAAMSKMAVPEMRKRGYDDRLSIGTVAASGTFAVMIPPSLALIIYGILTETSIADLFLAGVIPGLLTLLGYGGVIYAWGLANPDVLSDRTERFTFSEKMESTRAIWPALIVIFLVIGGLYLGVVTPTEAGALGASGTLIIGIVIGHMRLPEINNALLRTAELTVMIFMIVIGAMIFGRFLATSGATRELLQFVEALPVNRWIILTIILVIYVVLGTVMDQLAILILTLPITFPIAIELGYDPIWFGIIITKTIEIGLITPPLGLNVYVASGALDEDVTIAFKGAIRFIPVDVAIIFLLMLFPGIVTWVH